MKQKLILLTVLLAALCAFSQTANLTWATNAGSITVTGYLGTPASLTIPDSINGLSVTSIGNYAFAFCTSLTNIALGSSVTGIGGYAFAGCTSLAGVTIPDSVTSIGESALNGCTGLTSVMIGSGVSSIGDSALNGCSSLISITVNATNSFYSSMAGVLFDKSQATLIRYPGGGAGSYSIPSSVTSIGDRAFGAAGRLTSVMIPGSVASIKGAAFNGCSGLTSVTIPNSVTNIGSAAFAWCTSLSSVTIPDSITSIGFGLFYSCASLSSVTIPYSITSIGDQAFTDCTGLMGVYFRGNAPSLGGTLVFSGDTSATIYRLSGATGWPTVPNLWAGRPTALYSADVYYTLTVNSGSGSGSYTNGEQVSISADAPASGKVFDRWTGATQYVANASSSSTTVTMPAQAIAVTATYKDITYTLTVNSGSGDGSYTNGQQVAIEADTFVYIQIWPPVPQRIFEAWTGDIQYVANIHSSTTTVTMPAQAIAVTATYKEVTNSPPVDLGLDSDGDGLKDWEEYIAGTDPSNVVSVLKAALAQTQDNRNVITWSPVTGRVYSVYWSTNLMNGFQPLETNILPPQNSYTNTTPDSGVNYYQIKVRSQ